jgi:hypothetical protein
VGVYFQVGMLTALCATLPPRGTPPYSASSIVVDARVFAM